MPLASRLALFYEILDRPLAIRAKIQQLPTGPQTCAARAAISYSS